MGRDRFSIRSLMILIVLLGVAFAALRTPSRLWANAWFSLTLAALTLTFYLIAVLLERALVRWEQ